MDGMGHGQSPNYFAAVSDLARDVGGIEAQVNERVTYKELMAQNTQQRHEITSRIEKVEEHLAENIRQSIAALDSRIDAMSEQIATLARTTAASAQNGGGGRVALGSMTTTLGAAVGIGGYLLLRAFGVTP